MEWGNQNMVYNYNRLEKGIKCFFNIYYCFVLVGCFKIVTSVQIIAGETINFDMIPP